MTHGKFANPQRVDKDIVASVTGLSRQKTKRNPPGSHEQSNVLRVEIV
jgi:hypothetical protein